jgi:hypothetical protein
MNYDNTRLGIGDDYNCGIYGCGATCNNGDDIWNGLVSNHPNIILVISGHAMGKLNSGDIGSTGRMTDYVYGQPIHQLLQNYQVEMPYGGNGWLRYYTFKPNESIIEGWTYSPYLDEYEHSSHNRFDLIYPQDSDNDGIPDSEDNCPYVFNPGQEDDDSDGSGDVCDNCIDDYNPFQFDCDDDGEGDICDADTIDPDGDGVDIECDNCPNHPNGTLGTCVKTKAGVLVSYRVGDPKDYITCDGNEDCTSTGGTCQMEQIDSNGNGCGDVCECYAEYKVDGFVDGGDLAQLKKDYGQTCPCLADGNDDGFVDGGDLALLKNEYGRVDCPTCQ